MRVVLCVEYDGSAFHGWQRQQNASSIQGEIEKSLAIICQQSIIVVAAGRTDRGVHALAQYVHFDVDILRSPAAWVAGVNSQLPAAIKAWGAVLVANDFDVRKSALARTYRYIIYNSSKKPALFKDNLTWYYYPLDALKMHQAAQSWLGEQDFSSFRDSQCQSKSPIRRLDEISVTRQNQCVVVEVTANAFLHHMVRNMVGVLLPIGSGQRPVVWAREVIGAKDRTKAGVTAAPNGLYLSKVRYDASWGIPGREERLIIL